MRSLWTGSISFGLVTIPVTMYSASKQRSINFDLLRREDLCPISYKKVCKADDKEVPLEQIVKGFEVSKGKYVILDDEDFKRAAQEKSDSIDIELFIDESEIDSIYYEKPYYLEPGKGGDKAYALLHKVLSKSKKVGIATMVFRAREDLVVVKPVGDLLAIVQLRYAEEIRSSEELKRPKQVKISSPEMESAQELVDKMKGTFDPAKHHDMYFKKLEKVIKAKAKGKKLKPVKKVARPAAPVDLVSQLKASLVA